MKHIFVVALFAFALAAWAQAPAAPQTPPTPEISADMGTCSVEFHVTDFAGKALYNAKIHAQIRYGFLAKRKLDLDIATDGNGKARFVKLPNELKKPPLTFTVTNGKDTADISYDPATNCQASYDVPLGKKQE